MCCTSLQGTQNFFEALNKKRNQYKIGGMKKKTINKFNVVSETLHISIFLKK